MKTIPFLADQNWIPIAHFLFTVIEYSLLTIGPVVLLEKGFSKIAEKVKNVTHLQNLISIHTCFRLRRSGLFILMLLIQDAMYYRLCS